MDSFDYVIVGGGTAACILAYRLGDQGNSVCVLEAGPPDRNPYIRIPAGWVKTLPNPAVTWQMKFVGSAGTNGRLTPIVGGKTLGGSSAVNGAVYNRGQSRDYDTWCALGNKGWSYEDLLPYFKRTEHFYGDGDPRYRGQDGRLPVSVPEWHGQTCDAFFQGAQSVGIPFNSDYNGSDQLGFGRVQSTTFRNERWSAARAFLHPAKRKFGTRIITEALVTTILLDGGRATGVCYRRGSDMQKIRATRAVVLCAGAIGSPKLLQQSGIGPAGVLKRAGVDVVHNLPGVGENLQDHYVARVVVKAHQGVATINERVRGLHLAREILAWHLRKPSVLALSPVLVYAFWKSTAELPRADFALSYFPASYKAGMIGYLDDEPGLTCGAFQLRPESRGCIRIQSPEPTEQPLIQPNFLNSEIDQSVIVASLKCARDVMSSAPFRPLVRSEVLPGADVQTDLEWLHYARQFGSTGYHVVGTCKMGPSSDPVSVVDEKLKVHGLEGLYVVDASIMPTLPSANTAAATMAIAEKGADLICGRNSDTISNEAAAGLLFQSRDLDTKANLIRHQSKARHL